MPVDAFARMLAQGGVSRHSAQGSTDANVTLFQSLFGAPSNGRVLLDRGYYDIGNTTLTFNQSEMIVQGLRGGTTIRTSAKTLLDFQNVNDVVFENINFLSEAVSSGEDPTNALIRWLHRTSRRIDFINCTFAISGANVNAIKAIADTGAEVTESIHFYGCDIKGAGRMGLELSNHPNTVGQPNDTVTRHFDWVWEGGSVKNTGLVSPDYGMGISVTGFAEDLRIDTRFDNNMTCGVEFVGACNSKISGRLTNMRDVTSGGSTPSAAISMTYNAELDKSRKMTDNRVVDFICDDLTSREIRLWGQDRLVTRNNLFRLAKGSSDRGYVSYAGTTNAKSSGDRYDCDGSHALFCRTELSHGGEVSFCDWENLRIDHSSSAAAASLIGFSGNLTDNNSIGDLSYRVSSANANEPLIFSRQETTLTASISGTTMTVTAASGYPLAVGQKLYGDNVQALTAITALGTGTGGTGTYTVSISQTAASGSVRAGIALKNFIRGTLRSFTGFDFVNNSYNMAGDFTVDLNLTDNWANLLASRNLTITSASALTTTRSLIFPEGGPVQTITNSTTGGQSITIRNKTGGTTVTIANGATVKVRSSSAGFAVVP